MSRTVLVLAATGTTGQHVVAALASRGAVVRAASRDPRRASLPEGVEAVAFDLDDESTWGAALAGVDALYLAMPPFREDEAARGAALVEAAKAAGVSRIVKLSAMGVDAQPESGHRQVELLVEGSGLAWVHLRPTFFMDNFVSFWGQGIQHHGVIGLPAGTGRTGFIAASDIGEVAAEALLSDASGEVWTLTGPESLDHQTVAAQLSEVLGRPVQFVDVEPEGFRGTLASYGMPPLGVQVMSGLYDMVRAGWTDAVVPDAERVLGRPLVTWRQWAQDNASAWS